MGENEGYYDVRVLRFAYARERKGAESLVVGLRCKCLTCNAQSMSSQNEKMTDGGRERVIF